MTAYTSSMSVSSRSSYKTDPFHFRSRSHYEQVRRTGSRSSTQNCFATIFILYFVYKYRRAAIVKREEIIVSLWGKRIINAANNHPIG
jgi:hypothetical protein